MSMLTKCEGIVIRAMDYGESNKIITLYTRELGKIGLMARGAKKPSSKLTSISQLFQHGYFLFQSGKGLGTLQQGEMITSLRLIREDIFKTAYASYIAELLDKGTEEKKSNPYLFQLFLQVLERFNEGDDLEVLTNIFEVKMLAVFGFSPELNRCVSCGEQEGRFSFSIREGGILCHRCLHTDRYSMPISPAVARLLRLFAYLDLERLGSISVKQDTKDELRKILDAYYDEYLGAVIKSKKFLDQIGRLKDQL